MSAIINTIYVFSLSGFIHCAAQYKGKIPDRLYNAMMDWKIELSDWDNE